MIILVYIVLFLVVTLVSIAMVLFFIFAIDSLARGHDLPTSRRAARALVKVIRQYKQDARFRNVICVHEAVVSASDFYLSQFLALYLWDLQGEYPVFHRSFSSIPVNLGR